MTPAELIYLAWLAALTWLVGAIALQIRGWDWHRTIVEVELWIASTEGRVWTAITCELCVEIRDHFACNGWIFGQLWEDLENNFFPEMVAGGPCMEGLSPTAKAALFEERTRWLLGGGQLEAGAPPPEEAAAP